MSSDKAFYVLRVKIWLETSEIEPVEQEWRGEIQKLGDNAIAYFRHLEGFADAVRDLGIGEDD